MIHGTEELKDALFQRRQSQHPGCSDSPPLPQDSALPAHRAVFLEAVRQGVPQKSTVPREQSYGPDYTLRMPFTWQHFFSSAKQT